MADVQLEVIDLDTGLTVGTFSLDICTPKTYELDLGSYRFKATYLPTGEAQTKDISIIGGTNPSIDFTFTPITIVSPTVETLVADTIADISAILNGNISSLGNDVSCSQIGFEVGTLPGVYTDEILSSVDSFGVGIFSLIITGLSPNATYYYRAKAKNSAGWAIASSEQSFTTITSSLPFGKVPPTQGGTYLYISGQGTGIKLASKYHSTYGGMFTAMFARLTNIPGWDASKPTLRMGIIDVSGTLLGITNVIQLAMLPSTIPLGTPMIFQFTLAQPVTLFPSADYYLVLWMDDYGGFDIWLDYAVDTKSGFLVLEDFSLPTGSIPASTDTSWNGVLYDFWAGSVAPRPPTATFVMEPPVAVTGVTVNFDASASLGGWDGIQPTTIIDPSGYVWDFGDGAVDTGKITTHVYVAGSYIIKLTVTDFAAQTDSITQALLVVTSGVAELLYATGFENATTNPRGWYLNLDPIPGTSPPIPQCNYVPNIPPGDKEWVQGIETPPAALPINFYMRPNSNRCLGLYGYATPGGNRSGLSLITNPIPGVTDNENGAALDEPNLTGDEFYISYWLFFPSFSLVSASDKWYQLFQLSEAYGVTGKSYPYWAFGVLGDTHLGVATGTYSAVITRRTNTTFAYVATVPNFNFPVGRWFKFEVYVLRHPINGVLMFWVDGVKIFDLSGLDTTCSDAASAGYPYGKYTIDLQMYCGESIGPKWMFVDDTEIWSTIPTGTPVQYTLTISSTVEGITDPTVGVHSYNVGATVQVTAIPLTGYMFDHWELDGVNIGSTSPYTVLMDTDHTLLAVFAEIPPPPPGKHNLTISMTVGGTTMPEAGTWEFNEGASVQVRANPDNEHSFDHWEFDGTVSKDNPITITMDADYSLLAMFTAKPAPIPLWQIGAAVLTGIGGTVAGIVVVSRRK